MSSISEHIKERLVSLPDTPGIYRYYDEEGTILYIGKAKNLKKRVSSYFNKNHDSARLTMLVRKIHDIQYIVVRTEFDALILENNLIKEYRPKYNINLKDDKTYPWICVKKEPYPRVFPTRKLIKDGSLYFGPYASGRMMHALLDLIREIYPLRTCNLNLTEANIEAGKFRVCLEYHMKRCLGPCEGKQALNAYEENISEIKNIIKGNFAAVLRDLKTQMKDAAENLDFEKAQLIKSQIESLENYQSRSAVVSSTVGNVNVFSLVKDDKFAYVNYLDVVNGIVVQSQTIEMKFNLDESQEELLELAIAEFRVKFGSDAKEIIVPFPLELETELFEITVPQRGDKRTLQELSHKNALQFMHDKHKQESIKNPERNTERIMEQMKSDLRLTEWPRHIECFDNSNIQGTNPVSACVVFKDGKPAKRDYRHFNIKTVEGPDDFASMEEVIYRRYKRLQEEEQPLPQLIVIDGGKGQLGAAMNSIEKLGLRGKIAVISIAKRLEEIYYPGDSVPMYIDKKSETLRIIQHMRNEAHRFGITHHRKRRSKVAIGSSLMEMDGIGEKTAQDLLKHFKSIKRLKEATKEQIEEVVGKARAEVVFEKLRE
ncbi:MAG TPA: excinuclease ABC subunit UvrC [Flavobacteriales bacterium]|nr:excinuclease ABC subunit UvrC [Flavobacteriales bacterium]